MPVLTLANSKGGPGKTTSCVILACELAREAAKQNIKIALIDVDPNQHTASWAKLPGRPENIIVYANITEDTVIETIEEAKKTASFVIVDLEGISSNAQIFAVSQSDLVLIPCQPSQNDAKEAVKTIKMIKNSSKAMNKEIPLRLFFNRVPAAILTKNYKFLVNQFKSQKIKILDSELVEREPYKSIFSYGGTVHDLEANKKKKSASVVSAINNAHSFTTSVKRALKDVISDRKLIRQKRAAEGVSHV